jgi:hypothetical protein
MAIPLPSQSRDNSQRKRLEIADDDLLPGQPLSDCGRLSIVIRTG